MKFSRLGIIAAMAMALCGQQALAADAPALKMNDKIHAQSMKDAPPLVEAAGRHTLSRLRERGDRA